MMADQFLEGLNLDADCHLIALSSPSKTSNIDCF